MRYLVDPQGREWRVYERLSGDIAPVAGQTSLIFETEGIVRRLWCYPAGWNDLPEDALASLMDSVTRRRTSVS